MRKLAWVGLAVSLLAVAVPAQAILITFEEGLGNDNGIINTQYTGVTFQSATAGTPWQYCDATTDAWNVSSWPTGQSWGSGQYWINGLVCASTTTQGDDGKIAFNAADATYVDVNYCSYSAFYLEAYDAGGNLLDSDSGAANLRYLNGNESGPGTLHVEAPVGQSIAYVLVHDSGNYWLLDNVSTDATGIIVGQVPEPLTMLAVGLGIGGLGGYLRRRRSA